ncbi:MAG: hypothetical protein FJ271_08560 [Planctomycetes bacterium]|nr:hypothetical protein [Planctomycetota bacterium]
MELYHFVRGALAWTVTIAALWPVNIPLAFAAYKIRQGPKPIDMPKNALWWRCTFATLLVAVMTVGFVIVDYMLAGWAGFPAGPIHLLVLMGYIPAAAGIFFVFFALEDFFQGLSMFMIYMYLPVLVLYVINAMIGVWNPLLNYAGGWLKAVT